ncbi:hypothetical protein Scep_021476 [Stephania cephalantha]|uniref:N-acetyltransferase domain-containing protein n=1 Tax=Stephania cephalantha TaxID=152367 RepID=A0AAP0F674_9MAGN
MAATISFSFSLDPHQHQQHQPWRSTIQHLPFTHIPTKPSTPLHLLHKSHHFPFTTPLSSSPSPPEPCLIDPLPTSGFMTNNELNKLRLLENFRYSHEFGSGSMWVGVMRAENLDSAVGLLSESFAESMSLPFGYVRFLAFLVKQYMVERRGVMPHMATLVAFYREEGGEEELAGTVEVSFNRRGANASPPTPAAPKDSPYVCNMAVKKPLRRKGIGWHLLKACEELIRQMSCAPINVYLHCRIIDTAPFSMYTKAGYSVVKTDNIFILLTLQRRKHLMRKRLEVVNDPLEAGVSSSDEYPYT